MNQEPTPKKSARQKRNKVLLIVSIVVLAAAIICGAVFLITFLPRFNQMQSEPLSLPTETPMPGVDSEDADKTGDATENPPLCGDVNEMTFLVVGIDYRDGGYLYGLADVIRLVHVDFTTADINIVALPRAIVIEEPGPNLDMPTPALLNQAYLYGTAGMGHFTGSGNGPGALAEAIQANFGVRVDNYVVVNFYAFQAIVNRLGGVEITLPAAVDARPAAFFPAGTQVLDGTDALILARNRKNSSDNARIDTQSILIKGILQKLVSPSVIPQLPGLFDALSSSVLTDITAQQVQTAVCMANKVNLDDIQFFNPSLELITDSRVYVPSVGKEMNVFLWDQDLVDWIQQSLTALPE
ncbi:LCP family protein [bacterium]|nr:LCP family protein [bacterium]